MATHSSILAWKTPWVEETSRLHSPWGHKESGTTERLHFLSFFPSLVAQSVKNLPVVQETWIQPLGWEDPLEKEIAAHSSIFAWEILWTEEPGGLPSMGSQKSDTT